MPGLEVVPIRPCGHPPSKHLCPEHQFPFGSLEPAATVSSLNWKAGLGSPPITPLQLERDAMPLWSLGPNAHLPGKAHHLPLTLYLALFPCSICSQFEGFLSVPLSSLLCMLLSALQADSISVVRMQPGSFETPHCQSGPMATIKHQENSFTLQH